MIFHATDMVCCNLWIKYLRDYDQFKVNTNDRMNLLNFKLRLVDNLINLGHFTAVLKSRETSSKCPKITPPVKKGKTSKIIPYPETRKDEIGHFSMHNNTIIYYYY